jgi:hypothetical protein
MKNIKKIIWSLLFISIILTGCKKDSFTFVGKWKVNYNFTGGPTGSFDADLKSNNSWNYTEGSFSSTDEGTWTSAGDSITIRFSKSGPAIYRGVKNSSTTMSGSIGDSPLAGTWTATK